MWHRRRGAGSVVQRLDGPGYRLPGENPAATSLDVAVRWAQTYGSLTTFERQLLEQCQKVVQESGPDGTDAIWDSDLIQLEVQASRFQLKRDFWRLRATELAGSERHGGAH
ncbi:MAG TPA: hypothetical protein VHM88_01985 [Candidatus Acidoferrales bacterium]|nr:hypothetical protein [Candidatus Acidoferrales bacterium]